MAGIAGSRTWAALAGGLAAIGLAWPAPAPAAGGTAVCGPNDAPETGYQGQTPRADMASLRSQDPYFCGLRIVGHSDIWNRGGNWQLARSQHCAYVASLKAAFIADPDDPVTTREPAGVAVIDARDPANPKAVGLLRYPGSVDSVETMHAIDAGDRHVLVAGHYAGGLQPGTFASVGPAAMDVYDVSDCAKPKHMATFMWPNNAHDLTLSPDGNRVYGTRGFVGVQVADISDLANPKFIGDYPLEFPDGSSTGCHTVTLNQAETRMYCAGSLSSAAKIDPPEAHNDGPSIWDVSDFPRATRDPKVRFVGEADIAGQGAHHAVYATINGKPHIVAADELASSYFDDRDGCAAAAYPRIFDASKEPVARLVGEFRLELQHHCGEQDVEAEYKIATFASHYNNVDDPWDTRLGLFGMLAAGVRIVDLRDPAKPREVAYYKPGANPNTTLQPAGVHGIGNAYYNPHVTEACGARNWVDPKTGYIWFSCQSNGFFIAELSPAVRAHMGLGATAPASPPARPTRPRRCRSSLRLKLRMPKGRRASRARVYVNGKRIRTVKLRGGRATLTLRRLKPGKARVVVFAGRLRGTRTMLHDRSYRICRR